VTSVVVVGGSAGAASTAKKTTTTTTIPRPAFSTASGTIAAVVPGTSMEVQNPSSGQVTVSWTSSTRFTQTVPLASSSLAVGDCVTASSSSTSKSKASSTHFTATNVSISQPSSTGSCTAGGAFGAGGAASTGAGGASGFRPPSGSFTRGSFPGGAAARNLTFSDAFGKVTSISGSTFVAVGTVPVLPSSSKSAKKSSSSSTKLKTTTRTSKVTFTSKTTFTQTVPATSTAVVVGQCATALGPASDTGAITASTISVRAPTSTGCVTTFGAGFGGGFGGRFAGGAG